MADALKVEAAMAIAAAANPVSMLRIMMLLLLSGDAPQPLSTKLGNYRRVAACGVVARPGTAGSHEGYWRIGPNADEKTLRHGVPESQRGRIDVGVQSQTYKAGCYAL
jgi:hypothetical protein